MAGTREFIQLSEFNLSDLAHELHDSVLPTQRNSSENADTVDGRSSSETAETQKRRSSPENADKTKWRSSSETAEKKERRSSSETARKDDGRSSSENADQEEGRSSSGHVRKEKRRSSSKHAKKKKKRRRHSSSERSSHKPRRNSPENVRKEVDEEEILDFRAATIPPTPSEELPLGDRPPGDKDEDSEDHSEKSEGEESRPSPEDHSGKRAPSVVSVVSSVPGGSDLSGVVMPIFQEEAELSPTLFALTDANRHMVETYLAGQSLTKEKLTEWRKKIPRPDHLFAQPAELDQMLRVYLTKKLNISPHNKAFELDAAMKDVGQNILNAFNPLFILQAINAERQPSPGEISSAIRFCFEYLSHSYMRSLFHRRHAFSGLMNLNDLGAFKQALETTPLSASSSTALTRGGGTKLAPSLFGKNLMDHIQQESASLRPFLKDMKFLISEGLSKAPRGSPQSSRGGGTSGRYANRYDPYKRPSDGRTGSGPSTSRDRPQDRSDRSGGGRYGESSGNSRFDSRHRGGGRGGRPGRGRPWAKH